MQTPPVKPFLIPQPFNSEVESVPSTNSSLILSPPSPLDSSFHFAIPLSSGSLPPPICPQSNVTSLDRLRFFLNAPRPPPHHPSLLSAPLLQHLQRNQSDDRTYPPPNIRVSGHGISEFFSLSASPLPAFLPPHPPLTLHPPHSIHPAPFRFPRDSQVPLSCNSLFPHLRPRGFP